MAIDTKLRYNPEAGEVELVVGDAVAMSSGKDVFDSWGQHWAAANDYVHKSEIPEPVVQAPTPQPQEVAPVSKENDSAAPEGKPVEEVNPSEPARPPGPGSEDEKNE